MDKFFQEIIGAVVGSAVLGGAGLLVTWGMVRQMVKSQEERIQKAEDRIERLQSDGRQMPALAQAIEHMGEKFADGLKSLAERFGERDGHIKDQLADIKEEQRIVRDELGVRRRRGANLSTGSR
jgi:CRP-like cAMP-binding protein